MPEPTETAPTGNHEENQWDPERKENPVPCTDPWDPNYDYEFERSQIKRSDITVLPPERFTDEPMPEHRKKNLRGEWYEKAKKAGPRNSPIVEGRFAQVCCGWPDPPTAEELYEAVRAENPTETPAGRLHDMALRVTGVRADRGMGRQRVHDTATRKGDVRTRLGDRPPKPVPEQLRATTTDAEMRARHVDLPEPANRIWSRATALVDALLKECKTLEDDKWYLGGGTALSAEWRHRNSTDIDILIAPGLSMASLHGNSKKRLSELINATNGTRIDAPDQKLSATYGEHGKVDIFSSGRQLPGHEEKIEVAGRTTLRLSNAQIFAGKFRRAIDQHVAARRPVRRLPRSTNLEIPECSKRSTR